MGLEIVELIMAVEERFGIEIPDQDAERLETVGAIHAYIWNKLEMRQTVPCPNIVAFNQLRRSLVATQGIERRRIAPSTRLAELLPANDRQTRWAELNDSQGRRLPGLELPRPLQTLFLCLNVGGTGSLLAVSWHEYLAGSALWAAVSIAMGALLLWLTAKTAAALSVQVPASCITVGTVVKRVLQPDIDTPGPDGRFWTKQEAWEALRSLFVEELEVPAEHVIPDAFLVDDLGLG